MFTWDMVRVSLPFDEFDVCMPMDKAEAMRRKSRQAAETFPWGLTREQALAEGWQPSGVREGNWRKISV